MHANIDVHIRRLIPEFPKDGIKCIDKLQSHCENMTFSDKSRSGKTFQQVTHKGGESEINYIKRFQNSHALSVSVGNSYSEDQLMHTFLDNFHQGGKYSAQIASHKAELRREEKITDQKSLNISSLQTDYLNLGSSSGSSRNSEISHAVQEKCTFCGGNNNSAEKCFKRIRKEKEKARAVDVSSNRHTERTPWKCFICESGYHMIAKCTKPPEDNEKRQMQVRLNEKGNRACDNGENNDDHKIYASMARMSGDDKSKSENYGDSSQLINWILDSGAT